MRNFILPPRRTCNQDPKIRRYVEAVKVVKRPIEFLIPSNAIQLLLERESIERRHRQREKKIDSAVENKKCIAESSVDFGGASLDSRWVGDSPVRGHRLSRPQRTGLLGSLIADGKDEVHFWRAGAREFVPTLAAQACSGHVRQIKTL